MARRPGSDDDDDNDDEGKDDADKRPEDKPAIYSEGFCQVAAALGLRDPRDFSQFLGASNHKDRRQSVAVLEIPELEAKLAAAVEAGRLIPEPTPAIEGREVEAMTEIMRDKLRLWTLAEVEYEGAKVQVMSFDRDELTLAPEALVPGLLHARAHGETRLHPKLQTLLEQVPPDVAFTTVITPMATKDFMEEAGAMGKLLPDPEGLMIAAVVYDYAGLFVRVPTEDAVKGWLILSLARKLLDDAEDSEEDDSFMANLDISQTRDGKALLMSNILTRAAVLRMFLG
jgi:hypothetical protein